jgi:hypothetical protein
VKVYVDGFERSGNTFLGAALGYTLGVQTVPLWSHRISTLEARDRTCPFIVPVRDVLPSIVSAKVYRDYTWQHNIQSNERTGDPDELIKRYTDYTDYLLDNEDLFIAPFHEFTKDHNKVIDVIVKTFSDLPIVARWTSEQIIDKSSLQPHTDNPYLSNFPRVNPEENKEVEAMFLDQYSNELESIQNTINSLYLRYYEKQ